MPSRLAGMSLVLVAVSVVLFLTAEHYYRDQVLSERLFWTAIGFLVVGIITTLIALLREERTSKAPRKLVRNHKR